MGQMTVRQSQNDSFFVHDRIPANKYREYIKHKTSLDISELQCKKLQCCNLHTHQGWNRPTTIEKYIPENWHTTCQKNSFKKDVQELIANKEITEITLC